MHRGSRYLFSFVFYCKGPRTFGPRDSHRHFIYRLLRGVTNLRISLTGWPPKSDVERGEVLTSRHVTQNLWRFPCTSCTTFRQNMGCDQRGDHGKPGWTNTWSLIRVERCWTTDHERWDIAMGFSYHGNTHDIISQYITIIISTYIHNNIDRRYLKGFLRLSH